MSLPSAPLLVSLIIDIAGETAREEGHQYVYCKSIGQVARYLGWEHVAGVSTLCPLKPLPPGWSACIERVEYRPRYSILPAQFSQMPVGQSIYALSNSIARYLRSSVLRRSRPAILFLESFRLSQLMALTLALYKVPARELTVWLMYRLNVHRQLTRPIFGILHWLITQRVGRQRLVLSADSEPLANALSRAFHRQLHVLPIPHTSMMEAPVELPDWAQSSERSGKVLCWWPGRPHPEKGAALIKQLVTHTEPGAQQLFLVAARSSELVETLNSCHIKLIDNNLTRSDYLGWLAASDLILLPYDPAEYGTRTSGIFVEAIMAGKPAAVSTETWMAAELRKFGLDELIVDWHGARIFAECVRLARDAQIHIKVAQMQAAYAHYHSEQSYANQLRQILGCA